MLAKAIGSFGSLERGRLRAQAPGRCLLVKEAQVMIQSNDTDSRQEMQNQTMSPEFYDQPKENRAWRSCWPWIPAILLTGSFACRGSF